LLHEIIASLVIYEMVNKNEQDHGLPAIPETFTFDSCPNNGNGNGNGAGVGRTYRPSSPRSFDRRGKKKTNLILLRLEQIALASYVNPLADPVAWDRMIAYPSNKVSVLVANVLNGPDTTVNEDWAKVIDRAHASG
jgi:hypothetical protein